MRRSIRDSELTGLFVSMVVQKTMQKMKASFALDWALHTSRWPVPIAENPCARWRSQRGPVRVPERIPSGLSVSIEEPQRASHEYLTVGTFSLV
jgi:hypothetical protein